MQICISGVVICSVANEAARVILLHSEHTLQDLKVDFFSRPMILWNKSASERFYSQCHFKCIFHVILAMKSWAAAISYPLKFTKPIGHNSRKNRRKLSQFSLNVQKNIVSSWLEIYSLSVYKHLDRYGYVLMKKQKQHLFLEHFIFRSLMSLIAYWPWSKILLEYKHIAICK